MFKISLLLIMILGCAQQTRSHISSSRPVQATPAQNVSDSIVAAVLYSVATRGLPDFRPTHTLFVKKDSDIVSSAAASVARFRRVCLTRQRRCAATR